MASTVVADGIWELDEKDWDWVLGVNFYGTLYGIQSFVPHMINHNEEGHVLNTISLAGILPGEAIYGVSKHAALALSESLWQGLKNIKSNIGASVLCPGFVNTNIIESNRNRPDHLSSSNKTNFILKKLASSVLKRGKEPNEIADTTFDAIKQNHFYILPHTSYDEMIKERFSRILARTEPQSADMQEILKGTLMGNISKNNVHSFIGKSFCQCITNTAGSSRYHSCFTFKIFHHLLLATKTHINLMNHL